MYSSTNIVNANQSSQSSIEWESTISIKTSESEYKEILNNKKHSVDIIFLLQDGLRVSNRTVQKKTTLTRRKLLTYYKNHWIPLDRTTASEEMANLPSKVNVEKCIHRLIVYYQDNIRVSYNKEICSLGEKYNIEYEIEYISQSDYQKILIEERRLIELFLKHGNSIQRCTMTRLDMFSCVMSKVQMWHCFNNKIPYIWAYKWNGIKSKMLITDNKQSDGSMLTYLWSDSAKISNKMCRGTNIEHLINICCIVEILNDRLIIIEAIGTLIDGEIYTTEPMANASFLKQLDTLLTNDVFIDDTPVYVQKFFPPPLPNRYGADCDGFIIIQDDLIIKWKIPTIDVKCLSPNTFKVGSNNLQLNFIGEPGKIYEITYKYEVLRQRNDRSAASDDHEYAIFLESSKILLERDTATF